MKTHRPKSARRTLALTGAALGVVGVLVAPPSATASSPITLVDAATGVSSPVGIDYYAPTNTALMSVNYDTGGAPYNFETLDSAGTHTQFSSVSGLSDEVYIATIRTSACQGGFVAGDAFTGNGQPGQVVKISGVNGATVVDPWVTLPDETGLLRGGLFQDRYCALPAPYAGDLVVTTDSGDVWLVDSAGAPTKVASQFGGSYLEGPTTVPNDTAKYGPMAGKIVVSDESAWVVWAIDPTTGDANAYVPGNDTQAFAQAEGVHVIPSGENFYGVDYAEGKVVGAAAAQWTPYAGDLLVVTEDGRLLDVTWDSANDQFVSTQVADQIPQYEGSTFAPATLPGLNATTLTYDGATTGNYSDAVTLSATLTDTSSGNAIPNEPVDFTVSGVSVGTGTTDSFGRASVAYTVADSATPLPVDASFTGDSNHAASSDTNDTITVTPDECNLAYTGDVLVNALQSAGLKGQLSDPDDTAGDMSAHTLTFTLTDSAANTVLPKPTATTNAAGLGVVSQALLADTYEVGVDSNGNGRQAACSTLATTMVTVAAANAKATGGGWSSVGTGRFNFGFNLVPQAGGVYTGELQARTNNGKNLFHGRNVNSITASGSSAKWSGSGYWNGASGATFTITVVDNGTGGKKADTINLLIKNKSGATVFSTSGAVPIKGGNITVKTK